MPYPISFKTQRIISAQSQNGSCGIEAIIIQRANKRIHDISEKLKTKIKSDYRY